MLLKNHVLTKTWSRNLNADVQGSPVAVSDRTWDRLVENEVGNKEHRLYGGSQYHRTLREFHLASRCLRVPSISEDEIANAAGIGDTHDGVNFLHAACVISLEKARLSFEPLLEALRVRITHVMDRLCPVTEYMLRETQVRAKVSKERDATVTGGADISQNPQFRQLIRTIFDRFVTECSRTVSAMLNSTIVILRSTMCTHLLAVDLLFLTQAMEKCHDDLTSITRYVTWNLDERSSGALKRSLPDQTDLVAVYKVAVQASKKKGGKNDGEDTDEDSGVLTTKKEAQALVPISSGERNKDRDYVNLLQLMEEAACARDSNRTNMVVAGLVQHIVSQWRESFCRTVTMKFNC